MGSGEALRKDGANKFETVMLGMKLIPFNGFQGKASEKTSKLAWVPTSAM